MATRRKRGGASKKYFKVKLDLYFKQSESPEESWSFPQLSPEEKQAIVADYNATVEHYETYSIEDAVKQFDANEFTEYIYPEGRIVPGSAQWIDGEFAVEFTVEASPTTTAERVAQDLYMNSLEDGEYGSIDSNGWTMKTLNNEWEYGTTDYREHERIHVTPIDQIGGKRRKTRSRLRKSRKQRRRK
jgi:hypothetical protein